MSNHLSQLVTGFGRGALLISVLAGSSATAVAEKIYVVDRASPQKILRANLDGTDSETLAFGHSFVGLNLNGLALDVAAGKMYWISDPDGGKFRILRANMDIPEGETAGARTDLETLVTLTTSAREIDLDVAAGKMYWSETAAIKRANLDGTTIETVVSLSSGIREGIALDLADAKVYWTNTSGTIRRANLDGTGLETLLDGLSDPSGIALDLVAGKMYWADFGTDNIHWANLDGSDPDVVVAVGGDNPNPRKVAVDVVGAKLYWSQGSSGGVVSRANLDGSEPETIIPGLKWPFDLNVAVEIPTEGPPVDDTCFDGTDNDLDGDTDTADEDCIPFCAQPISRGNSPKASDCLWLLKTAVGSEDCPVNDCYCAPGGTTPGKASDALLCLRRGVGQQVDLNCPC